MILVIQREHSDRRIPCHNYRLYRTIGRGLDPPERKDVS